MNGVKGLNLGSVALVLALEGACLPTVRLAAQTPPLSPLTTSPLPRVTPQLQPVVRPLRQEAPAESAETDAAGEAPVTLDSLTIEGGSIYPESTVRTAFKALIGVKTTRGAVMNAVRLLQLRYRQDGYFLTKVVGSINEHPSGGSTLKLKVIEGYISRVRLADDIGPVGDLVYGYLNKLVGLHPLKMEDLERYVLLAQNVPGVTVRAVLRPMRSEPGAVELIAQLDLKPVDATISDDNRGPRTAGPNEVLASLAFNSFSALGDRTELLIFNTPFDKKELFGQVSNELLLGAEGLKLRSYLSYGQLTPGDVLRKAGYKSRLLLTGAELSYPVIRSRALSWRVSGAMDVTNAIIDLDETDRSASHRRSKSDLRIGRLGSHLDFQDTLFGPSFQAANAIDFKVHHGIPQFFNGTQTGAKSPSRPGEKNGFYKLTAEAKRTQQLYKWGVNSLALYTGVNAQWADVVLPASEKFFAGGAQYGRGYYNGEITGDRAVEASVELQFNDRIDASLLDDDAAIDVQYYGFYDLAQTWNVRSSGQPPQHTESTGVGMRTRLTDSVSVDLEGVDRFSRRPTGADTSLEPEHAVYFRVEGQM